MIRIPRPATTAAAMILIVLAFAAFAFGQRAKPKTPPGGQPAPAQKPLEMSYKLAFPQPHTHLYEVSLTIGNVTTPQLDLSLPIWTPGSYLAREYARHVQDFNAGDGSERPLPWRKIDKATWRIETAASADSQKTLRVSYRVYGNELATQTSHLDATHAYFNGASLFMYVPSAVDRPHRIKFITPEGWRVTTPLALKPDADGYYTAAAYHRLLHSPTEIGAHKLLE